MTKEDKNFNIPRGPESEYEVVRDKLKERIRSLESQNNQVQNRTSSTEVDFVPRQTFNSSDSQPFGASRDSHTPLHSQNQSFQKPYSSQQYESTFNTAQSQKINFNNLDNNLVAAGHSKEPVMYKPKPRKSGKKTFLVLILMIAIIIGLSWTLREFVFQPYEIPSGSMEKTIMTGDMVFAEKVSFLFGHPVPGQIVTFDDPQNPGRTLIKRVIAIEGQTIDIKNNKVYVDGEELKEDYINGRPTNVSSKSKFSFPYKIPDGCMWVMGDNRTNSSDSRVFGPVPMDTAIGHGVAVYWPISNARILN